MLSLPYIIVTVVILILFTAGLCSIIFSKRITAWIWRWSIPLSEKMLRITGYKDEDIDSIKSTSHLDKQYHFSIWIIRICGFLLVGTTIFMMLSMLIRILYH